MLNCTLQVRSDFKQDPQVFEGLHTLNNIAFKHNLLAWINWIEHHDFYFFRVHHKSTFNTKLL
jgi:hypothetical protein